MAEARVAHPTAEPSVSSIHGADDTRKQKFAYMLESKVGQGYEIESQGDTEAVLFMRGRRTWFGLFAGHGAGARQLISVDDEGAAKTRKLSPSATT